LINTALINAALNTTRATRHDETLLLSKRGGEAQVIADAFIGERVEEGLKSSLVCLREVQALWGSTRSLAKSRVKVWMSLDTIAVVIDDITECSE
jgi:hypothetical protein